MSRDHRTAHLPSQHHAGTHPGVEVEATFPGRPFCRESSGSFSCSSSAVWGSACLSRLTLKVLGGWVMAGESGHPTILPVTLNSHPCIQPHISPPPPLGCTCTPSPGASPGFSMPVAPSQLSPPASPTPTIFYKRAEMKSLAAHSRSPILFFLVDVF